MNLTDALKKSVVIKNTHYYNAKITIYRGDVFDKTTKAVEEYVIFSCNNSFQRNLLLKQNKKKIQYNKAGFHDFTLDTTYIISGAGTLCCNLVVYKLPVALIKSITRSQGVYYFEDKKKDNPAFTIKIEIITNNCKYLHPIYYLISTAKIVSGTYPNYAFQMQGTPAANTIATGGEINVQSKPISTNAGIFYGVSRYDVKKAIAKKYNRGYLSLDSSYDSCFFEFPKNGYLVVDNLLEQLNTLFPEQQHIVDETLIISMKKHSNITYMGKINNSASFLNDNKTTLYRSSEIEQALKANMQKEISNRHTFYYDEKNNVINDIITLQDVAQIAVKVALTPPLRIGDRVIIKSYKSNYNKIYNNMYYVQAVMHNLSFNAHLPSKGQTQLYLVTTETELMV